MKIRILSDLHLEFDVDSNITFSVPMLETDKETTLVLAGDICVASDYSSVVMKMMLESLSNRFKHIVYVMGNHEHYKGKFTLTHGLLKSKLQHLSNVHVLEKNDIILDGVSFIGATMWASMKHDPILMYDASMYMNDYKKIRIGPKTSPWLRKLSPQDTISDHVIAKKFIFDKIEEHQKLNRKTVVITHHAPCDLSVHEFYANHAMNCAYVTDLFEDIYAAQPTLWLHGHMHMSSDYYIDNTRVLSNPRGYASIGEVNPQFNPSLLIEV